MKRRCVGSRAFFLSGLLLAAASGCASEPAGLDADPAAQGVTRADHWRADGFPAMAARQYEESARLAEDAGDLSLQISCLVDASSCWLLDGRPSVAAVLVEKAARLPGALPPASSRLRVAEFRIFCAQGDVAAVGGRASEARERYEAALTRAMSRERDLVTMRLSLLAERQGDRKRAKNLEGGLADPANPELAELRRMLLPAGSVAAAAKPDRPDAKSSAPASAPRSDVVVPSGPPVLSRLAWGARRPRPNLDRMTPIWRITIHHTATRLASSSARVAADAINKFQREHQDDKGWADIGYHFIIDPSGRIWEGRALTWQGAHAGNPELNVGNIGIALIGDFTLQQPSASQKKALGDLLDSLCARYHVTPGHVYSHQEIRPGPTDCPGPALQRVIDGWRRSARATGP